jgi:hypothetical protein
MNKIAWLLAKFMWMPISTAPHSKKLLVCYWPYGRKILTMAKYYPAGTLNASDNSDTEDEFAPADWYEETWEYDDLHCLSVDPTHWRRLPRAPSCKPRGEPAREGGESPAKPQGE